MLSKMNSRCEVYPSWKKCSKIFVNSEYQTSRNQVLSNRNDLKTERKHNGRMDYSWEVRRKVAHQSDEPPLLLLLLLFGLIFV